MADVVTRKYGWKRQIGDIRDFAFKPTKKATRYPTALDLRGPLMPPVYDQGQIGSCTANAIAAALEYDRCKQVLGTWTPARLAIYWNERTIEGTTKSDAGATIRDGMKSLTKYGYTHEANWPYKQANLFKAPPAPVVADELTRTAELYQAVTQTQDGLCAAIASGFPVVFGFSVYESFESATVAKTGVVPMPKKGEKLLGGHAVLLVGYDLTKETWLVRNSWGASWGQAGYFTMPLAYLLNTTLASDFWVVQHVAQ